MRKCIGYISNSLVVILLLLLFDPSYVDTPTPKACLIEGVGVTTILSHAMRESAKLLKTVYLKIEVSHNSCYGGTLIIFHPSYVCSPNPMACLIKGILVTTKPTNTVGGGSATSRDQFLENSLGVWTKEKLLLLGVSLLVLGR